MLTLLTTGFLTLTKLISGLGDSRIIKSILSSSTKP